MILAELCGNVAARFMTEGQNRGADDRNGIQSSKVRGFIALFVGLFLLSISWDRIECFPFTATFVEKWGFSLFPKENCFRIWPVLLPFLSGFLGCYERISMNWGTIRQLGRKRVRLISLFFTTVVLFIPALVSVLMFEKDGDDVSIGDLTWPLANTVLFGVLLSEAYSDEKLVSSKDLHREFALTFVCTLVLELFYFPELSLWGLFLCGFLLYIAVRELDPFYSNYLELGLESSESATSMIMKPIRHILSERKSRKIALFLLINTAYMVVEFVAGFMSNSLGLISDACHMLFDCAALAIGLYASYISRLPANGQYNYGRGRFEVLSGYVNAVFLVLVGAVIVLESFERILDPQEISTNSLLTVSVGGLLVNVVGLIFFHEEHHHAHGGGSCSHSHSHSHNDFHTNPIEYSHDNVGPAHERKHLECVTFSNEKLGFGHNDHKENNYCSQHESTNRCGEVHMIESTSCHNFQDHAHSHNNHDHAHSRDHHDHVHSCGHHDHAPSHNHHDHAHVHDHHNHHDHDHSHDHDCDHAHDHDHHHPGSHHSQSDLLEKVSGFDQVKVLSATGESQKHRHRHIDHNMEGIFLHVLADTMGSVGVVVSTLLIKYKGWLVADPASSIFISLLIISSVIPLLKNSAEILLQRVPRAIEHDLKEALNTVRKIKGVRGVHNLHVWSFTNTDVVGTLHVHVSAETDKASTKAQVSHILYDAGIKDLTLQVECVGKLMG